MIAINNLAGIGNRVLSVDYLGNIIPLGSYSKPCQTSSIETWFVGGNWFPAQGVSNPLFFGTCTNHDLAIGINANTHMYITQNKIGVGTTTPSKKLKLPQN
ncbi:MAG: hypothetical protein IPO27_12350 [Bacteroidetes bacterium]|nr:hypothetical protein [Bacteroidota bacterium]